MSKYEPLGNFLRRQKADLVTASFADIERIIGTKLPASAQYRAWWSNNAFNSVMTKVWLEAGFKTEQVDIDGEKLVFRRVLRSVNSVESDKFHPLAGLLKEVTRVPPRADLTKPADPDWGDK